MRPKAQTCSWANKPANLFFRFRVLLAQLQVAMPAIRLSSGDPGRINSIDPARATRSK